MFTANSLYFLHVDAVYKVDYKMCFVFLLLVTLRYHCGILTFSSSVYRVRDCSSEEPFHLVIKIQQLLSENAWCVS